MTLTVSTPSVTSEWVPPHELPDLTRAKTIAIDVETKDPNLKKMGPGWARGDGEVVGTPWQPQSGPDTSPLGTKAAAT